MGRLLTDEEAATADWYHAWENLDFPGHATIESASLEAISCMDRPSPFFRIYCFKRYTPTEEDKARAADAALDAILRNIIPGQDEYEPPQIRPNPEGGRAELLAGLVEQIDSLLARSVVLKGVPFGHVKVDLADFLKSHPGRPDREPTNLDKWLARREAKRCRT